jgi:hypothetical protein
MKSVALHSWDVPPPPLLLLLLLEERPTPGGDGTTM